MFDNVVPFCLVFLAFTFASSTADRPIRSVGGFSNRGAGLYDDWVYSTASLGGPKSHRRSSADEALSSTVVRDPLGDSIGPRYGAAGSVTHDDNDDDDQIRFFSDEFVFDETDYVETLDSKGDDYDYLVFASSRARDVPSSYSSSSSSPAAVNELRRRPSPYDDGILPKVYVRSVPLLRRSRRQTLGQKLADKLSSSKDKSISSSILKPDPPSMFNLTTPSPLLPKLDGIPKLDGLPKLDGIPKLDNVPKLDDIPKLDGIPKIDLKNITSLPVDPAVLSDVFGFPQMVDKRGSTVVLPKLFDRRPMFPFAPLTTVDDRQKQIVENIHQALQNLDYLHKLFSGFEVMPFAAFPLHAHVKNYCKFFHANDGNEQQLALLNKNVADMVALLKGNKLPFSGSSSTPSPTPVFDSKVALDDGPQTQTDVETKKNNVPKADDSAVAFGKCVERARDMCIRNNAAMDNTDNDKSSAANGLGLLDLDAMCHDWSDRRRSNGTNSNGTSATNGGTNDGVRSDHRSSEDEHMAMLVNRTNYLVNNVDLRIAVPGDPGSNKKIKVVTLTPELLARRMRSVVDQFPDGMGLVSICYHNQPPRMFGDYPNSPNDTQEVREMFSGTRDAAHNPSKGVDLDRPDYINALMLDMKHLDRDYIALCIEDPSPSSDQLYPSKCLNLRIRRNN